MHLRPYSIGFIVVNNQRLTHTLHLWEGSHLAIKGIADVKRSFPLVRKGKFAAPSDRCGPDGIEALPGLHLPPLTTNRKTNVFTSGPKGGLATRVFHEEFDNLVDASNQIKAIFFQFKPAIEVVRNTEAGVHEYHTNPNDTS